MKWDVHFNFTFFLNCMLNILFVIKNNIIRKHELLDPNIGHLFNEQNIFFWITREGCVG